MYMCNALVSKENEVHHFPAEIRARSDQNSMEQVGFELRDHYGNTVVILQPFQHRRSLFCGWQIVDTRLGRAPAAVPEYY